MREEKAKGQIYPKLNIIKAREAKDMKWNEMKSFHQRVIKKLDDEIQGDSERKWVQRRAKRLRAKEGRRE